MSAAIASAILDQVDRELARPHDRCLVCGTPSEREWCGNHCRLQLWQMRRGIAPRFDLFEGDWE